MIRYVLFDLDGTIIEPAEGITNSAKYALEYFNINVKSNNELLNFIGPPLLDSFKDYYGFDDNKALEAIKIFRKYYQDIGILQCSLYPNIKILLNNLKERGYILAIATSKPQVYATKILKHFNIDKYFTLIAGASLDGKISKKADVIKYALDTLNIKNNHEVIMVGDRMHDVIGAQFHNIDCIGVLYGYGSKEEFIDCNCNYIISNPLDILEILK